MKIVLAILIFKCVFGSPDGPRAKTENGPVVGTYDTSASGSKFNSFKGIPYAKPPVGEYRFKEPQRLKEKWIGEWNAQNFGGHCLQLDHFTKTRLDETNNKYQMHGTEDCLFLNIYYREDGPLKKNVVFMIHGGAFMFGSADFYNPNIIMNRDDIVLVTINYRLGPLGFITTGDNVVPGNNGLKDQVAALEWVHRNIANFRGDPSKITIAGLSAGGASVDYMFLTPMTKGLFQRGFSFSGTSLCPWALVENGVERTKQLAERLGCPLNDSKTILKCLRRRPAEQIVQKVESFLTLLYNPFTTFGPVVENNSTNYYINEHPREILNQGLAKDLPWVVGVTSEDGLYPAADFVTKEAVMKKINDDWEQLGSDLLFLDPNLSHEEKREISRAVRQKYFGDKNIDISTRKDLIKLFTDRYFLAATVETAKLRKKSHLYYYTHQSALSFSSALTENSEKLGASHVDDFSHIVPFDPAFKSSKTDEDSAMASVIQDIFFTFVANGKVPKKYNWTLLSAENKYLRLDSPTSNYLSDELLIDLEEYFALFGVTEKREKDEL